MDDELRAIHVDHMPGYSRGYSKGYVDGYSEAIKQLLPKLQKPVPKILVTTQGNLERLKKEYDIE